MAATRSIVRSTLIRTRRSDVVGGDGERRFDLLRQYGSFSMAYHTLQPGLKYFETAFGYLAYQRWWGLDLVLADPVCHADDRERLIDDFLLGRRKVVFCQVTRPIAECLVARGYKANELGVEYDLDLGCWQPSGRKKAHIREGDNRLRREGYRLVEMPAAEVDREQLRRLSENWRATKAVSKHETRFLSRSLVLDDEPDVRRFHLLDARSEVVGLFTFDPIYENGEVVGYLSNHKRHTSGLPRDFEFGVHRQVIERFAAEGRRRLSLGLCPMYRVTDEELPANRLTSRFFQWLYNRDSQRLFGFRGVAEHKRRYRGIESKVYFVSKARSNVVRLFALARLCRVL